MIETIPCRYILIKYCIITHKKRFCEKANISYEKRSPTSKLDFWQLRFWHGGRVTKSFTVNFLFMIETIPCRYILIKYCIITHKKRFCDKANISYEKRSPTSKLDFWLLRFWHGGSITKSFTVNFLFMIETILCRYVLIKYCFLTQKKRFCKKTIASYEKRSPTSKLDFWQLRFWHGGRVAKSFTVNFLFMIETILCRYVLIKYCFLTQKKSFCKKTIASDEKMSPTSKLDFW